MEVVYMWSPYLCYILRHKHSTEEISSMSLCNIPLLLCSPLSKVTIIPRKKKYNKDCVFSRYYEKKNPNSIKKRKENARSAF